MSTAQVEIAHAFVRGATVEARADDGSWVVAIVQRLEPYRGLPGYYVSYPAAFEQWHCHGGWKAETSVRALTLCASRLDAWDRLTQHLRLQTGAPLPCRVPFGSLRLACNACHAEKGSACSIRARVPS